MDGAEGVEVWRGGVSAWETDHMGHFNVAFYIDRLGEALIGMAAELGMPAAFTPGADSSLIVRDNHLRFHREARVLEQMTMTGAVLEMGESDARLLFILRHADGQMAASFNVAVAHVTAREGRAFPWPARIRARAAALMTSLPAQAAPRTFTLDPVASQASAERAQALGLTRIGMGALQARDCDVFGRVTPFAVMGRITNAAPRIFAPVLGDLRNADGHLLGAAVVEYRAVFMQTPGPGRRYEICSGFSDGDATIRRMVHWVLDRESGRPWAVAQSASMSFDLQARKAVKLDAAALAGVQPHLIPGLTL